MPRKLTTYLRPSLVTQIEMGLGTEEQLMALAADLEKRGACNKTLKRIRKALAKRFPTP